MLPDESVATTSDPLAREMTKRVDAPAMPPERARRLLLSRAVAMLVVTAWSSALSVTPAAAIVVGGGGSAKSDCVLEFQMAANPASITLDKNGNPSPKQRCTDGDPACDFDNVPGQCTFRLAACINVVDTRTPECSSNAVTAFIVKAPSAKDALNPNKPGDAANRAALLSLTDDDGPFRLPDGSPNNCASFDEIVVMKPGKATKKTIKFQVVTSQTISGKTKTVKDSDNLQLTCAP